MAASAAFVALLKETLAPLGHITVRRMFGGAGAYCDGLFFAIVDDDVLYLRVDEANRERFDAEGALPFTYAAKGKPHVMAGYRRAPERLYDEPEELLDWARSAIDAARRSKVSKTGRA